MNGYLVVISGTMDELPVRLFGTHTAACNWAYGCNYKKEAEIVAKQREIDIAGDLVCIRVQKFLGGVSVRDEVVRDLETEDDDAKGGAS